MKQGLTEQYLLTTPPNGQVWHKAFLKVGPRAGSEPRHVRHSQKCLGPRQHSPKERRLRCQAINLAPPMRVKTWGKGPLRLEEINHPTQMSDSQLKKPLQEAGIDQAVFVVSPTKWESVTQGHFKGESECRTGAHTNPAAPKMPRTPSAFP